jgi:hypothetical protein
MSIDGVELSDWEWILRFAVPVPEPPVADSSNHNFEYIALEGPRDIRLFYLLPAATYDEEISGGLLHISLDSSVAYETISYVWGNPIVCENMRLRYLSSRSDPIGTQSQNEAFETFDITTNLPTALRNLRYRIVPRLLWIDAICINQNDVDERAQQVQLMASIYELGAQSIVWLGPESENSTRALKFIEACESDVRRIQLKLKNDDSYGVEKGKLLDRLKETRSNRDWDDCISLFETRRLWNRIWILQEIVLAPNPRIYCGKVVLPWGKLGTFVENFEPPGTAPQQALIAWKHAMTMEKLRKVFQTGWKEDSTLKEHSDLLPLLRSCHTFCSSDPKDMLFAILNIVSDNAGILPNYRLSPVDMWAAATKVIMMREKSLALFHMPPFITRNKYESWLRDLPSWVVTTLRAENFFLLSSDGTPGHEFKKKGGSDYTRGVRENPARVTELIVDSIWLDTLGPGADEVISLHDFLHNSINWYLLSTQLVPSTIDNLIRLCSIENDPKDLWWGDEPTRLLHKLTGSQRGQLTALEECRGGPDCQVLHCAASSALEDWPETKFKQLLPLKFSITQKGFRVLLPPSAEEGDCLHHVHGSSASLVLRPIPWSRYYFYVVGSAAVYEMNCGGDIPNRYYDGRDKQVKTLNVRDPEPIVLV